MAQNRIGSIRTDDNIVRNQTQWKVVAALDIGYENMIRDWNATVAKLASVLGVDESCANFDAIAREVSEMSGPTAFSTDGDMIP